MKNIFNRFFLSYLLILFMPIVGLGALSYWGVSSALTYQTEQSYAAMVNELTNSMDEQFNELNNATIQYSCTPWVNKIINMKGNKFDKNIMDSVELNNHVTELQGYDTSNSFIDAASLVFPEQDIVISSTVAQDQESFFNIAYRLNGYDYYNWQKLLNQCRSTEILELKRLYNDEKSLEVLTYIEPLPSTDQERHAYFVAFINYDYLVSRLKGYQISNKSSIYILDDRDSTIMSVNGNDNFYKSFEDIKRKIGNRHMGIAGINGDKNFIFQQTSYINKWKYIITIPYNVVMQKISYLELVTIISAILLSIAGLFLSYWLSAHNYDPIMGMVNQLKEKFSYRELPSGNEYDFLNNSISMLLKQEDFLSKQSKQNKPFVRDAYFMQLLNGNTDNVETSTDVLKSIDVVFKYDNYIVLLFMLSKACSIDAQYQRKCQQLSEMFESSIYFTELNGIRKASVINTRDPEIIKELVFGLKEITESQLGVKCIIGVGKPCKRIGDIQYSYKEASKVVDYKLVNDNSNIIFFEDIDTTNNAYYYPIERELDILYELRRGNLNEAIKTIDEVVTINTGNNGFTMINGRYLFYDMMGTLLKALNDLKLDKCIRIDRKYLNEMGTIQEMQDYINNICREICKDVKESKVSNSDILKVDILNYIDENISNPNLSLESVSDYVGKSVPYISKFFKKQIGDTFLDYLNHRRINKAKALLNGQTTIAEIASLVGYNSDASFRRVFKKYEGMIPSEYIMRQKQDDDKQLMVSEKDAAKELS